MHLFRYFLLFSVVSVSVDALNAQTTATTTQQAKPISDKALKHWLHQREWAGGLILPLHATADIRSFHDQYTANKIYWDSAFSFLRNRDLQQMAPGKYPIIGEQVFASITEAPSKQKEEAKWESHRKYIDLHYIIRGKELIGIADASKATITKPYSFDATNYEADGTFYEAGPDTFFLLFPNDAHKANIKAEGYDVVKKLVIKIQVAE